MFHKYSEVNVNILSLLNIGLQDVHFGAPVINLITFFCNLKSVIDLLSTPQNIIPNLSHKWRSAFIGFVMSARLFVCMHQCGPTGSIL